MDALDVIADLEQRLARYPVDRYPIQHATAQFHLGGVLADAGRLREAAEALQVASELFEPDLLSVEHAKAINALGAVHRLLGELDLAADTFGRAATLFEKAGLPLERGAALFNLGLVRRDQNDIQTAVRCFTQARELLDPDTVPAEAGAAARELGASLLTVGEFDAAIDVLESGVKLAAGAGDAASRGAATNLLGLSHLAAERPAAAIEAFQESIAAHSRAVRPGEYAMAKANIALAYERVAAADHAYLAAAQALGTPGSAHPVRAQAAALLARLGQRDAALQAVLDTEPEDRWPVLMREELARWVDADPDRRRAEAGEWVDGQMARPGSAVDLAVTWLGGLLELPPESMISLIRATLEALADRDPSVSETFRFTVSRAVVRFHVPQWTRLKESFNQVAAELGQEGSWG
jgi:tetratricopeptide (TPR) repeat protein